MNKPRVILTMNDHPASDSLTLRNDYCRRLLAGGALPLLTPHIAPADAEELLDTAHGLLLTGGGDASPAAFGAAQLLEPRGYSPARDAAELALARAAFRRNLPVFAICRGMQMLNIALGGDIYQDIALEFGATPIAHDQSESRYTATHDVELTDSGLARKLGLPANGRLRVNSHHHQAVRRIAPSLRAAAQAPDGLCEAITAAEPERFMLGVQWHPECLPEMQALFDLFCAACRKVV